MLFKRAKGGGAGPALPTSLEGVRRRRTDLGFREIRNSNEGPHTNPVFSWRVKKNYSLSPSCFTVVAAGREATRDGWRTRSPSPLPPSFPNFTQTLAFHTLQATVFNRSWKTHLEMQSCREWMWGKERGRWKVRTKMKKNTLLAWTFGMFQNHKKCLKL